MNKFAILIALAFTLHGADGQTPKKEAELFQADDLKNEPVRAKPGAGETTEPAAANKQGQTEIDADNGEIDNKKHLAIFTGNVLVKNPEFNVTCDRLTAYLRHDDKSANEGPKPATPANAAAKKKNSGGLEKAVAEMTNGGAKVMITQEKAEADGTITRSVGKGEKAVYNALTGEITLSGWPEIRQGINSTVASREDTVIILNREGKMRTVGRVKYLVQDTEPEKQGGKP